MTKRTDTSPDFVVTSWRTISRENSDPTLFLNLGSQFKSNSHAALAFISHIRKYDRNCPLRAPIQFSGLFVNLPNNTH
jgi:hypothetical protein